MSLIRILIHNTWHCGWTAMEMPFGEDCHNHCKAGSFVSLLWFSELTVMCSLWWSGEPESLEKPT
jgi:hypothetical protein